MTAAPPIAPTTAPIAVHIDTGRQPAGPADGADLSTVMKMAADKLSVTYGSRTAVREVTIAVPERSILALIGPSGSGKSTVLRCFNRMNDLIPGAAVSGSLTLDGEDITPEDIDVVELRRRVGMVFQRPNPFPMTIYENVAYGPRRRGLKDKAKLDEIVDDEPAAGRPVGRGQGRLPQEVGPRPVRRPAAAPVHRARAGHRARGAS